MPCLSKMIRYKKNSKFETFKIRYFRACYNEINV